MGNKLPDGLVDLEAERRVLVGVLEGVIDHQAVDQSMFPSVPAAVAEAALEIGEHGPPGGGGLAALAERLTAEDLAQIGGLSGLTAFIVDTVPIVSQEQQERLLARLVELRDRRAVFAGVARLARGAVDAAVSVERLRAGAMSLAAGLPDRGAGRKQNWTLAELMTAEIQPPKWVVDQLVPAGLIILSGRPKSGKSFLALQLAVAVAGGTPFLDRATIEGPVLYVALEDSPGRLQQRIAAWDAPAHLPMQFAFSWPSLAGDGLETLLQTVDRLAPALVVVDTLSRAFAGGGQRLDWNAQGDVTEVLAPLQTAALERGLALVAVDHHRKTKGLDADPIDDLLGSSAKSGVLDTALGLYRERLTGKGTLAITGRDVEESELALQWDGLTRSWQLRGDARDVAVADAETDTLSALRELGGRADAGAVARQLGKARVNARRALERLAARGAVKRAVVGDRGMVVYEVVGSET